MLSEPQPHQRRGESKHLVLPMREHHYYVYMMISSSRRALYVGVTNNLERRVYQHKNDQFEGFSQEYRAHRLVWFERYSNIHTAIAREKQLKGWRRDKKNWLVQMANPEWKDLSAEWGKPIEMLTQSRHKVLRLALASQARVRPRSG